MSKSTLTCFLIALGCVGLLLTPAHYTTDMGNGVTLVADKYVNTGRWVYHCQDIYLVKRKIMPFPTDEFIKQGRVLPGLILLDPEQKKVANTVINELIKEENWHAQLRYAFSDINEQDDIQSHLFWRATHHKNTTWVIWVRQSLASTRLHNYYISALPYDPATHMTHQRALNKALISCPKPQ